MRLEILTADTPNKNNRVYPRHVIENAINQARERVANSRFLVTIQQPQTAEIPLTEVAGVVRSIDVEGDKVMAEMEILDNHNGIQLKEGLESGQLHLRTSGMGTVQPNEAGIDVVQNDYEMVCLFATNEPA